MATYVEIFLRPLDSRSVQSVVEEVAEVVGASLTQEPKYDEEAYVGLRDDIAIELFVDHDHQDDEDMPFASHPYMLRFRPLKRDVDKARIYLQHSYENLRAIRKYSMFSTYDLQHPINSDVVTR